VVISSFRKLFFERDVIYNIKEEMYIFIKAKKKFKKTKKVLKRG